jgi:energy-coupling factor transporter transmembrane protein EcfT
MRIISALDPACRLLCLALATTAVFFASITTTVVIALGLFGLLLLEGYAPGRILRESSFLLVFIVFAGILECVEIRGGFTIMLSAPIETPLLGARLFAGYLGGRVYYATTSASQTRDAVTRIVRRVPGLSRSDLGLVFGLVLGFIPLIITEWKASLEAAVSRGLGRGSGLRGISRFTAAYLRRLILSAVAVPEALMARGWNVRRRVDPVRWKGRDYAAGALSAAMLMLAILRIV